MSSKSIPYLNFDKITSELSSSVIRIECPDIFIEKMIVDKVSKSLLKKGEVEKKYAQEVSLNWIEDTVFSPGLFSTTNQFIILEADKLTKSVLEVLGDRDFIDEQRIILFHVGVLSKALLKNKVFKESHHVKVSPPKFWEAIQYVDTYTKFFDLKLSYQAKQHILQSVDGTANSFFNAISLLAPYAKDGNVSDVEVKRLVRPGFLDNFKLSDAFNSKNIKEVWKSLLLIESDYSEFRTFFSFMQGHIIKIMDTSYMNAKKKLSKYDNGIMAAQRNWSKEDLSFYLSLFSSLEIKAKSKDAFLRDELRSYYLEN